MIFQTELRGLKQFCDKSQKLWSLSFTQTIVNEGSGFKFSFEQGTDVLAERYGPSEESIDAFVLTLRFFIQNNEESSLKNVTAHIDRLQKAGWVADEIASNWHQARDSINEFLGTPTFLTEQWQRNGAIEKEETYTYGRIMDVFVYGELAHSRDAAKKELFDHWHGNSLTFPLIQERFINTIGRLVCTFEEMRRSIVEPAIQQVASNLGAI